MIVRCIASSHIAAMLLCFEIMLFMKVKGRTPDSLAPTPDAAFTIYVTFAILWAAVHLIMWREPEEDS